MKRTASFFVFLLILCSRGVLGSTIDCSPAASTSYVNSWGYSFIKADSASRYVYQYMYWHDLNRLAWLNVPSYFNPNSGTYFFDTTFELDTIFYNYDGKAYGAAPVGWWSSDLPSPYVDTQAFDPPEEKAVTIGSGHGDEIHAGRVYYYATRFTNGGGNSSLVKLQAQRGRCTTAHSEPFGVGCGTLQSFACNSASNFERPVPFRYDGSGYYAPGCRQYWWQWPYTTDQPYSPCI